MLFFSHFIIILIELFLQMKAWANAEDKARAMSGEVNAGEEEVSVVHQQEEGGAGRGSECWEVGAWEASLGR